MTIDARNKRIALSATALIAFAMIAVPSAAHAQDTFDAWDTDDDRRVTRGEFNEGMTRGGMFGEFDRDANLVLDESEVKSGVFRYLDRNDDGNLEPAEFREGWNAWFPSEPPELEAIDVDDDGVIDEREFEQAEVDVGVYEGRETSEGRGVVTEEEFYAGIYESWDTDGDATLAEDEWNRREDGDVFPLGAN